MARSLVLASILLLGTFAAQAGSFPGVRTTSEVRRGDSEQEQQEKKKETDEQRKERKVRKLLEVSNQKGISESGLELIRPLYTKMGLPEAFIAKFLERMSVDELLDITAAIYGKNLEEESIDALTAFYGTDEGKKIAAIMPTITKESTQKGSELGERIAKEIMSENK